MNHKPRQPSDSPQDIGSTLYKCSVTVQSVIELLVIKGGKRKPPSEAATNLQQFSWINYHHDISGRLKYRNEEIQSLQQLL